MMRDVAVFVFRSEAFVTSDLYSDQIVRFYTYIKFDSIAKYCITIVWFEVMHCNSGENGKTGNLLLENNRTIRIIAWQVG